MTLQTPPPLSTTPQAVPPALKQQNQRIITDESDDEKINSTPVTFPLLMSQKKLVPTVAPRPVVATAPSHDYHPPPSISLQPQSRDFMKFPICKRANSREVTESQSTVITHSIPIRPPEQQCFRGRSPSLQLMIDDELNECPSETTARSNMVHHAKTPCHLARRGAEERTYLESQLRAEENIRKKHHWENEERKAREERLTIQDDENDAHNDDEISELMEKFTDFELDSTGISYAECVSKWVPVKQNKKLRNVAPSPPIILQKTFKRSVSAVIADSRGEDDDDACVLFFPDGLPLVDEFYNEGTTSIKSHTILENCNSFDLDSKCTSPQTYDVTEGSTPQCTISCHSSPESVECQPVLTGGELEIAAAGQNLRGSFNKKVTLRPKMTVRPKTPAKSMRQDDDSGRGADFQAIPDQIDLYSRLFEESSEGEGCSAHLGESLLFLEAADKQGHEDTISGLSRTFKRLDSDATIVRKNGEFPNELTKANSLECSQTETPTHVQDWNYSSPEPIRRSQFHVNDSILPPPPPLNQETTPIEALELKLREPLSESNYCTPDHSNVTMKKQLGLRPSGVLDPLPELILPSLKKELKPASFQEELPETSEAINRATKVLDR